MSAISSSQGSTTSSSSTASANSATSLTPSDFINFLVTELQNQDPLNPTSSDEMLSQMSEIGQLQSSNTLQTDLTNLVQQNQVSASSSFIGKQIAGTDVYNNSVTGIVSAVQVTTNGVNLQLENGDTIGISSVTSISDPGTTSSTTSTTTSGTTGGTTSGS